MTTFYDRVFVAVSLSGAAFVPGDAVSGYLGFDEVTAGDTVPYVVEDGSAWETGHAVWDGTSLSRTVERSSLGVGLALSSLTRKARLSVTALASDLAAVDVSDKADTDLSNVAAVDVSDKASAGYGYVPQDPAALAAVALSGAYADLSGKPSLAAVATSGAYADLTGKPALAAVATSGAYGDLSGRPTLGGAASLNVGTSSGTVAAGDDSRITGAAQKSASQTFTGVQTFGAGSSQPVLIDRAAGLERSIGWRSGGVFRWIMGTTADTESGSNVGSNFILKRYDDAGNYNGTIFSIARDTGICNFGAGQLTIGGAVPMMGGTQTAQQSIRRDGASALRLIDAGLGGSALSSTMPGLDLLTAGMGTTSKYAQAIKWFSTDPQFTTENPKLLAAIVPFATETYSLDTNGGMAVGVFATPNAPGASSLPAHVASFHGSGDFSVLGDVLVGAVSTSGDVGNLRLTVRQTEQFSVGNVTDRTAAHILLESSSGTQGDGQYGQGVGFSAIATTGAGRRAALASFQDGSDADNVGLVLLTATNGTATDRSLSPQLRVRAQAQGGGAEVMYRSAWRPLVGKITSNMTITIPTDFATLQAAIDELSLYPTKPGVTIELRLAAGHVPTVGLVLADGDFSQFKITCATPQSGTDANGILNPQLTLNPATFPAGTSFMKLERATGPRFAMLLSMNGRTATTAGYGAAGGVGIEVLDGSTLRVEASCGVIRATGVYGSSDGTPGIKVDGASRLFARNAVFAYNGRGVWLARGSAADIENIDVRRCQDIGLYASRAGDVAATGIKADDIPYAAVDSVTIHTAHAGIGVCSNRSFVAAPSDYPYPDTRATSAKNCHRGFLAQNSGILDASEAVATGCVYSFAAEGGTISAEYVSSASGSTNVFYVSKGGILRTFASSAAYSCNIAKNTLTTDGIIFQ